MPPKKQKEEEIDISTLPPWFPVNCVIKCQGKKQRMQNFLNLIKQHPKSFQKNITREEIIEYAKEKGLYTDPNSLNEKQKKDPKLLETLNLELTPLVISKAFIALRQELDLKGRKAKKDKLEGKEEVDDKKVDPKKKKEDPKNVKKGGKVVEQPKEEEEKKEEVEPEKEYKKALDIIYFLFDFPQTQEDAAALAKNDGQIDLLFDIREKVLWNNQEPDMSLLDPKENFDEDIRQRMDEFIDGDEEQQNEDEENEEGKPKKQKKEVLTEEDLAYIEESKNFVKEFKQTRANSNRNSSIRKSVVKEVVFEIDPYAEEESFKNFIDYLIEEICQYSFDFQAYQEWIQGKKQVPLCPKEALKLHEEEEEERQRQLAKQQAEQAALEEQEALKKKGGKAAPQKQDPKKDAKKDAKKEEVKVEEVKPVEEPPKKEEPPKPVQEPFYQYYKQLNEVNLQKTTAGILLECLIDQIESEKLQAQEQVHPKDKEESEQINQILNNLTNFVDYSSNNSLQCYKKQLLLNQIDKNTPYKAIIDECDEIEKSSHNAYLANMDQISRRERDLFSLLLFPGIDRNMMPEIPDKSEPLRKAEKSQLYPFIGCNVYEFERRLTITRFEEMMKEVEPEREWNFGNRIYMERHNKNTLSQQLYKALIYEPSIITKYNDKDDNLYVAMYFKNPPGRILRKKWNADWKVLPNLENWINYFKNSENNIKNEVYYDIDYELIGNLHERTKYMYPNDNSVIFGTKFQVGDQFHYRYKVVKEGVIFGIKESNNLSNFWALFENNSLFFVELEGKQKRQRSLQGTQAQIDEGNQDMIEKEVPNEEQLAEDLKASITITLVNGLVNKFLPNGDVFQTKLEHDKKTLTRDFEDIVNPHDTPKPNSETEIKRIITGKGSVIKYMKDGSISVLYANGNVSFCQQRNGIWITTNNKGLRKLRNTKDGTETEQDHVPCAKRIDPESGSKIIIRGDQTTIITYRDGSVYTKHKDGTQMLTSAKKDYIIIEHPEFSTVKVLLDEVKARTDTVIGLGSAYANVGFDNLFERSNNGIIIETYLPDGTKVVGYKEKQELPGYNQFQTNHIHLIYFDDGSVGKVLDNGEVVFISAVDRVALNKNGQNKPFGEDLDFWLQLFCVPEERKAGVYNISLKERILWTRDDEGNFFALKSNGEIDTKIAVSLNLNQNQVDGPNSNLNPLDRPQTPDFQEGEFIEEENKFLPQPSSWVPIRLFTINNDNTGFELFNEEQVQNYFRLKEKDPTCVNLFDDQVPNYQNCKSISFISQLLNLEDKKIIQIKPEIPRNLDIIPKTEQKKTEPEKKSYLFRNFLKFEEFNGEKREQHKQDLEKYDLWKKDQVKQSNEYGIIQKTEEERDAEFNIQLKILESRKREFKDEKYDQVKNNITKIFLDRSDFVIGAHKVLSATDLANLESPKKENAPLTYKREDNRSQTQIARELKSEKLKNKPRDSQLESLKVQKKKDFFVSHYFETQEGNTALNAMPKDIFNPVVVAANIKDTNKKEIDELKKSGIEFENQTLKNSTMRNSTQRLSQQLTPKQDFGQNDQPIVQLEPEQDQRNRYTQGQQRTIVIKPSVFTQRDIDEEKQLIENEREALRHRKVKTKEYNVYGTERRDDQTKKVPCLLKTNPISELNQKYIQTDSLTDKRIKMASMANRMHINAPSISELRNTGSHQTLAKTLDKKFNIDELENRKNLMLTSDLNDQLRKDIQILPASVRFGVLCANRIYETKLVIKNEDVLAQRVTLKQPQTQHVKVFLNELGPIPMGLTREVIVRLNTSQEIIGKFQEEFQIISKHQIYKIPIFANIIEQREYDELEKETKELHNKPLLKTFVKEIEFNKRKDQKSLINDSQQSDLFPKINNFDRTYKIDPNNNINKGGNQQQDSFDQSFAD
ncbi:hypothetical protein TTHERM_00430030 (macronuclear) [Tetrahymena thermophila SB210]|uniref:Uncharacterized protein n=1 Tax=Tetrahymena thermophila (strain SB210) TaxID=312017 RepID=Q231F7_TETTS|nr:hypothetical protein TTHERM_00430030 [Tetrahymena thermophila SB210]EAR91082.3 hypothetical protein TTHERM_00430030 [Tetrahymena thermophila SB210]|eukprot:XP_001011327.3 hypothetical protein TTHERM_00430030 [Tetrahymena thermophila SB210]